MESSLVGSGVAIADPDAAGEQADVAGGVCEIIALVHAAQPFGVLQGTVFHRAQHHLHGSGHGIAEKETVHFTVGSTKAGHVLRGNRHRNGGVVIAIGDPYAVSVISVHGQIDNAIHQMAPDEVVGDL